MTQKITFHTSKIIKLNDFLRKELPFEVAKKIDLKDSQCEFSNSKIRRLILSGCVLVNNQKINRPAFELRGNSSITVFFEPEKFFYEKQTNDIDFVLTEKDILFEDQNLIFTKNRPANKIISETFQNHNLIKEYVAICPVPTQQTQHQTKLQNIKVGDSFTVEGFMGRISGKSSQGKWGFVSEKDGGQFSKTDFIVKSKVKVEGIECFVIKCSLFTGRTHQIRVHMKHLGYPLIGDFLYNPDFTYIKRQALHSYRLEFSHPITNEALSFTQNPPKDFYFLPWEI